MPKPAGTLVAGWQVSWSCAPPTKISDWRELYAGVAASPVSSARDVHSKEKLPTLVALTTIDQARAEPQDTVGVLTGVHGGDACVRDASRCAMRFRARDIRTRGSAPTPH